MYPDLEGKYTLETLQNERNITRQSALNIIQSLKRHNRVQLIPGSKKRIYKITRKPIEQTNGMYEILNKTPITLNEDIKHYSYGAPTSIEQTIIDALGKKAVRYQMAVVFLINKITNWKKLMTKLKEKKLQNDFMYVYHVARESFRVKKIPAIYENISESKLPFTKKDILEIKND